MKMSPVRTNNSKMSEILTPRVATMPISLAPHTFLAKVQKVAELLEVAFGEAVAADDSIAIPRNDPTSEMTSHEGALVTCSYNMRGFLEGITQPSLIFQTDIYIIYIVLYFVYHHTYIERHVY